MLHDEGGAALVEFALIAIILLVLVFGMVDFGRAIYAKNSITHAAREGGRYAAVHAPGSEAAIVDVVVARMSPFGGAPIKPDDVTVTTHYAGGPSTPIEYIEVAVNYPFKPITPVAKLIGLGTLTLKASSQFRWELGGTE